MDATTRFRVYRVVVLNVLYLVNSSLLEEKVFQNQSITTSSDRDRAFQHACSENRQPSFSKPINCLKGIESVIPCQSTCRANLSNQPTRIIRSLLVPTRREMQALCHFHEHHYRRRYLSNDSQCTLFFNSKFDAGMIGSSRGSSTRQDTMC